MLRNMCRSTPESESVGNNSNGIQPATHTKKKEYLPSREVSFVASTSRVSVVVSTPGAAKVT